MAGVPTNQLAPFIGVDFDSSKAAAGAAPYPVNPLIIGQRLTAGTVAAEIKYEATTPDEVSLKSGFGSMLHMDAVKFFKNAGNSKCTFLALDDAAGTAGTYVYTIGGVATKTGAFIAYVNGNRYATPVAVDDTGAVISAALELVISADVANLPCTTADSTGEITHTMKNKGIAADDMDVRFFANTGEIIPEGLTVTAVVKTAGTVDPDLADAIAVFGDDWFNIMVNPYSDTTNLDLLEDEAVLRDGPMIMKDFMAYQGMRADTGTLTTYGEDVANRNSNSIATAMAYGRTCSEHELAAAIAGAITKSILASDDGVAVPFHRLQLLGVTALDSNDRWTTTERNFLAVASIMTLSDEVGPATEACVTMYRQNSAGAADTAYQQQNTRFQLSYLRYTWRQWILSRFARAKLAKGTENAGSGQLIMTPERGETESIAWFRSMQKIGIVDTSSAALTQFIDELNVELSSSNPNRMDFILPPDLMNQFIVGSALMQFRE